MSRPDNFSKYKPWGFVAVLFMLGSSNHLSAEEIQPIQQLKDFPKIPQLPNIELKRIQEPIKPFNPLNLEKHNSNLQPALLPNFDKSLLVGDWKATQPFIAKYIGGVTKIEGILFTVLPDSSLNMEWTSEGVMYESTDKDGARRFASSFNYKILSNLVLLMITFSANGIKNGVVISFEILGMTKEDDKTTVLKLKNEGATIELIRE
jgi:hypothetical protein